MGKRKYEKPSFDVISTLEDDFIVMSPEGLNFDNNVIGDDETTYEWDW